MDNTGGECVSEDGHMDIDDILEETGRWGRFQILIQMLFMTLTLTIGFHSVFNYFIADDPPWRCVAGSNNTFCKQNTGKEFGRGNNRFSERCKLERTDWKYTTQKHHSFVTEFDLVCDKASLGALVSGIFYIGGVCGCLVTGIIADSFGRKIVLLGTLCLTFTCSLGCCYSVNVLQLIILRGALGAAQMSCFTTAFVTLSEFSAPSNRVLSANLSMLTYSLSYMLIDCAAYFERNWRELQFYVNFPSLLPLIAFSILPESPRWLLTRKKNEAALRVLNIIAKCNNKPSNHWLLRCPEASGKNNYTYIDLFRCWQVLLLTCALIWIWLTIGLVYYAIGLESSNLGGDMYQAFALSSLSELPADIVVVYACNRFGKKMSTLANIFISGILIGSLALVPHGYSMRYTVNITLSMLGRFCVTFALNAIYSWTFELFPTVLRSQGMSLCITFERLGGFAAPFLTSVLQDTNRVLPYVIMCTSALFSFLIGLLLPETNKRPTRENYDDFFAHPQNTEVNYVDIPREEICYNSNNQEDSDTLN